MPQRSHRTLSRKRGIPTNTGGELVSPLICIPGPAVGVTPAPTDAQASSAHASKAQPTPHPDFPSSSGGLAPLRPAVWSSLPAEHRQSQARSPMGQVVTRRTPHPIHRSTSPMNDRPQHRPPAHQASALRAYRALRGLRPALEARGISANRRASPAQRGERATESCAVGPIAGRARGESQDERRAGCRAATPRGRTQEPGTHRSPARPRERPSRKPLTRRLPRPTTHASRLRPCR